MIKTLVQTLQSVLKESTSLSLSLVFSSEMLISLISISKWWIMVLANRKKATMWTAIQKHTVTDPQFKNSRAENVLSKLLRERTQFFKFFSTGKHRFRIDNVIICKSVYRAWAAFKNAWQEEHMSNDPERKRGGTKIKKHTRLVGVQLWFCLPLGFLLFGLGLWVFESGLF